jgi:pyrroline-5-carboxylate reductase
MKNRKKRLYYRKMNQQEETIMKIAFIGAGKMATAIGRGLMNSAGVKWEAAACDPLPKARENFTKVTSIPCFESMAEALQGADVVLLAVKPQYAAAALKEASPMLGKVLLISIAAGLPIDKLALMAQTTRIIRVMPNTPALAGAGMSCFAPGGTVSAQDITWAESILKSIGRCRQVPEKLMDAVTGLSGSGPAYVFEFIMALADGGVYEGLPRDVALELAAQTVFGSAKMVLESTESPAVLRDAVISPAGTTARGVAKLDEGAFRSTVVKAVIAAAERSAELGKL